MVTIKRGGLSNQVLEALKDMIADHRFKPGTRINVEQLAKEFKVSRTPVWEAVRRLEMEGFLENVPNRGVFMIAFTPEMAIHLYEVRAELEDLAGRQAAQRISKKEMDQMAKSLKRQKLVIEKEDLIAYSRLDFEFHAAIYRNCGNPYLEEFLQAIKNKMRPIATHIEPILTRLYQDHVEILDSLKAGDPETTGATLRNHCQKMIQQIRESAKTNRWSTNPAKAMPKTGPMTSSI